jgi:hypothetical protein
MTAHTIFLLDPSGRYASGRTTTTISAAAPSLPPVPAVHWLRLDKEYGDTPRLALLRR